MSVSSIQFKAPEFQSIDGRDFSIAVAVTEESVPVARVMYDYDIDEYRVQMRLPDAQWTKPMPRKRIPDFIAYRAPKVIEHLSK